MRSTIIARGALAILLASALTPIATLADVNLVPNLPAGWAWPLVPRPTNDATAGSVPLPAALTGDAAATYFNSAWRNLGSSASRPFRNHSRLDGATVIVDRSCSTLEAGAAQQGINGGPFTLPAGRHTLELRVDATDEIAESNEADNDIARQWVWSPVAVPAGTVLTRAAPPERTGGWSAIPAGQDKFNNCDGLRFTTGMEWDVLYTWSPDPTVDVDLRYYEPGTGVSDGFANPLGTSLRAGRGVEAVLAKGVGTLERSYDVGVERAAGSGSYRVTHAVGQYVELGDSITFWFAQDEMLKVFYCMPYFPDQVSIWLQTGPEPSVAMGWVDPQRLAVGLAELPRTAATDDEGRARLDVEAVFAASHAVVVWRDPDWGTAPRHCGLKIGWALADLVPDTPVGWHSPLVPRTVTVGTGNPVTLPDTLPVTTTGPVYHVGLRNSGGGDANDLSEILVTLDGAPCDSLAIANVPANEGLALYPSTHPGRVLSGRHTVAMELNHEGTQHEATRANNRYGEQYCWGPQWAASTTFPEQPMYPPDRMGGFDLVGDGNGEVLWYNCAASRIPKAPGTVWWQAYAARSGLFGYYDYDLQLHERLDGSKDGFGESLARSEWNGEQTEYVRVNLNRTPRRSFDIGIVDWNEDWAWGDDVVASYAEAVTLGTAGDLTLAPYVSPGGQDLIQLYEWYFDEGWWMIHLDNLGPWDRYAMALHQADEVYGSRPFDAAVSRTDGEDIWLHVHVDQAGWCCLAVFQPYDSTLNEPLYQLSMYRGISGAPDVPSTPAVTSLVEASPNPFNPQVAIAFDLAAPARARLDVFDLRGALVRRLVDADLATGRQTVTWDGRDGDGRALPSGTYMARFAAGDVRQSRKLMLVR